MKHRTHSTGIVLILLMAVMGTQASFTTNYGDRVATSVTYIDVTENTDIGAYNAPTIGEDSISFGPLGIQAESATGDASSVTNNARLSFDVQANAGKSIQGVYLTESGDLTIYGSGTDATYVDVTANFTVTIFEINGVDTPDITDNFSINDFTPNADGTHELDTDGAAFGKIWNGAIFLNFSGMLANNGYTESDGATLAHVSLENVLTASSEVGSYAKTHKKTAGGLSITAEVIPEPASAVLLVGTASLLAFIRRKFIV